MNVVDSSAWLSYFAGDENAVSFSRPIEQIDKLLVPNITITAVFKYILRQHDEAIAPMEQGKVIPLDSSLAVDAAQLDADLKLSLADSVLYATANKVDALVWTQDSNFKSLDGVKFFSKKKKHIKPVQREHTFAMFVFCLNSSFSLFVKSIPKAF